MSVNRCKLWRVALTCPESDKQEVIDAEFVRHVSFACVRKVLERNRFLMWRVVLMLRILLSFHLMV